MSPEDPLSHRRHVIAEMVARTDWTPWQAVRYMRVELGLAVDELAKLSGVPKAALETIDRGEATGTVEELDNLLGVLGLKLGVVQSPLASQLDVVAVEALPDYTLRVTFSNSETGLFEMAGLVGLSEGIFAALREPALFGQAFVACGTVCWPGDIRLDPGLIYRRSVPESRDTSRRIGIAKGSFEVPSEGLPYPYDAEWGAMPDVGREAWPVYANDVAAWAMDQAEALRNRAMAKLDWTNLADEILDVAKTEQRELGKRVSALMASLCRHDAAPGTAAARLVREHQKLVLLQLSDCPSLERYLSDPTWLSHRWVDAVAGLGAEGFPVEELPEENPWDVLRLLHKTTPEV